MISKLWPARSAKQPDGPIVDLDAIIAEPVPFRFRGKIHVLEPIDLESFLKFTSAQAELMRTLNDKENPLGADEFAQKMHRLYSSVCKTLTLQDVQKMEQSQVAALYQLVLDLTTGQVDKGDGKKKRTKIPIYDIARASSSPSVPKPSDGAPTPH